MKCKPVQEAPTGAEWLYELKYDGFRFVGAKGGGEVRMWSRTENDLTARFPGVARALAKLKPRSLLVDGELIVADAQGRPSFQLIQNAALDSPVRAFLFDVLECEGEDWKSRPLAERRAQLQKVLHKAPPELLFSTELQGDSEVLLQEIAARGLEGLIAKRRDSTYEVGRRSGAWRKIKCLLEQEFVVGGFTAPKGSRSHLGALLVGYYDDAGELRFAGRVGTGFSERTLSSLSKTLRKREAAQSPFKSLQRPRSRFGRELTAAELAQCVWVAPEFVAQIRFAEWTHDGILRQPSFLGLREDKPAREVRRET